MVEEKERNHMVLACQLEELLNKPSASADATNFKRTIDAKMQSFPFRIYPKKSLTDVIIDEDNHKVVNDSIIEHHRSELSADRAGAVQGRTQVREVTR
jgi:hypothetical protein